MKVKVRYDHKQLRWSVQTNDPSPSQVIPPPNGFYLAEVEFYYSQEYEASDCQKSIPRIYAAGDFTSAIPYAAFPLYQWQQTILDYRTKRLSIITENLTRNPKRLIQSIKSAKLAFFHTLNRNALVYEPQTI